MLALLLFLVLAYIVVGIVGFVVHGLFWLFVVAAVAFVVTMVVASFRRGHAARAKA